MIIDAIVPAGGQNDPSFAEICGAKAKAEVIVGPQTLLTSVIGAIKTSPSIRRTVVISNLGLKSQIESAGCAFLEEGSSGPENIFKGLDYLVGQPEPPSHILISTVDLPFLAPKHIEWLIENSNEGKEIYVPAVRKEDFLALYPECPSTFVKLKSESLTLGGIFLLEAQALKNSQPHLEQIFNNRKSIFKMASMIGLGFAIKYFTKQLDVCDLENKISDILKCSGRALLGSPAELAFDVDDPDDYKYAVKWVSENGFPTPASA